ncbi:hypothetical protein SUGI_0078850 [Cryptomeria japonica]|nr:hypothetical protein SUGI_0078850 [Cryptomeria japonica]
MGKAQCCSYVGMKRGPWTPEEDYLLIKYIQAHGEGNWRTLPVKAGLSRCGKGCRLRWMNYLRPNVKRGHISSDEEEMIIRLHKLLGNRWSLIAGRIPGRTDNEVKNYWNTHLSKRFNVTKVVNRKAQRKPICADKNGEGNGNIQWIHERPVLQEEEGSNPKLYVVQDTVESIPSLNGCDEQAAIIDYNNAIDNVFNDPWVYGNHIFSSQNACPPAYDTSSSVCYNGSSSSGNINYCFNPTGEESITQFDNSVSAVQPHVQMPNHEYGFQVEAQSAQNVLLNSTVQPTDEYCVPLLSFSDWLNYIQLSN